ncbi:hypothetical protein IW152_006045 [Coemansia sp. BCRC 34962]|nr:hypothetical protein IW152_006045 [Coemansia sp. BCRC 34962]
MPYQGTNSRFPTRGGGNSSRFNPYDRSSTDHRLEESQTSFGGYDNREYDRGGAGYRASRRSLSPARYASSRGYHGSDTGEVEGVGGAAAKLVFDTPPSVGGEHIEEEVNPVVVVVAANLKATVMTKSIAKAIAVLLKSFMATRALRRASPKLVATPTEAQAETKSMSSLPFKILSKDQPRLCMNRAKVK